jgi:DNA-binding MarR family transcriptional regulator
VKCTRIWGLKASSEMSDQDQEATPVHAVSSSGESPEPQSTPATSFPLNESPSHLLHRAQQAAADLHAAALGANGLTQRQFAVLAVLAAQDGVSQSELVVRTGIDRSTLAEMVARMEAKGLTQRTKSVTDSRANSVTLTASGRAMFEEAMPKLAEVDAAVLTRLPAGKRAGFVELLTRLAMPTADLDETKAGGKKKKDKKKKKKKEKKAK